MSSSVFVQSCEALAGLSSLLQRKLRGVRLKASLTEDVCTAWASGMLPLGSQSSRMSYSVVGLNPESFQVLCQCLV